MPMSMRSGSWRHVAFLVSILWSVTCVRGSGQPQQADKGMRDLSRDNLIFTGADLLWVTARTSVVTCASACVRDPLCVCFTAIRTGSGKVECRGHSSQTPQGGVSHPGARLYLLQSPPHPSPTVTTAQSPSPSSDTLTEPPLPTTTEPHLPTITVTTSGLTSTIQKAAWLNRTCSRNADCQETNSECFLDQCLCTPGYYYSESTAACLRACSPQDLGSDFLRYKGYMISENNIGNILSLTVPECLQACVRSPTACLSVDYNVHYDTCDLNTVSHGDSSPWTKISYFEYYQRTCK